MHARLTLFKVKPDVTRETMEKIASRMFKIQRKMNGFHSATFLANDDTKMYGGLSAWESKEHADVAAQILVPQFLEALMEVIVGPPTIEEFEV